MQSNEVLLVTASIHIQNTPYVTVRGERERLAQYLTSLIAWIKMSNISTIVFCENSNTTFDFSKIIDFAESQGKVLEVLIFSGNQESQKYGKGYGEGRIVEYAIKNSRHLAGSVNFYKITGRLFVPEFNLIQQMHLAEPNVFDIPAFSPQNDPWIGIQLPEPKTFGQHLRAKLRYLYVYFGRGRGRGPHDYSKHVSTVFYKANIDFFKKNLLHSYRRVNDSKSYALEHTFYEDLVGKRFSPFLTSPTLMGRSGSTGKSYDHDYPEEIKNFAESFCEN